MGKRFMRSRLETGTAMSGMEKYPQLLSLGLC